MWSLERKKLGPHSRSRRILRDGRDVPDDHQEMNVAVGYRGRPAASVQRQLSSSASLTKIALRNGLNSKPVPWTCVDCRDLIRSQRAPLSEYNRAWKRHLSTSNRRQEERSKSASTDRNTTKKPAPTNDALDGESSLPSKKDQRRWQVSKRMAHMMDSILARASIAGQHINVYTGTDYSGIEALRKSIIDQEIKVREGHEFIETARTTHREAHTKQASSQKEIVGLLERKSSWSPEDLERYMSLVRSEHADEQAVQTAKDELQAAERDLESSRSLLERMERKQYHEEQIWSDTIRRNSTWVTFGLMGLNIFLLLAQIAIFEPYRRRKIVKEVNLAFDEKTGGANSAAVARQVDEVVEPKGISIEAIEQTPAPKLVELPIDLTEGVVAVPIASGEVQPVEALKISDSSRPTTSSSSRPGTWSETWEVYKESLHDLFSERVVQVKKIDITYTALQGAATGVAAIGILFILWRPT